MLPPLVPASAGDSFDSFFDAVDSFFSGIADIRFGPLLLALLAFAIYLALRSRASFHILRAAYPDQRIQWREVWAAYMSGYGFNSIVPARGGDVVRLFLTHSAVPKSSYPAVASSFAVELIFDAVMGTLILIFAFSQGVFPKPPDFSKLPAFDLAFFASHPRFALFLITLLAVLTLVGIAVLSARVRAFWARVRQGLTILSDRRRYFREVFAVQLVGWCFRFTGFWFMLEAFNVGGSVRNVLLVLGVQAVSAVVPFTPGGAGVQQAFLVKVFGSGAAAYSVGQQIAIATFTFAIGFAALVFVFRIRSFKEAIALGQQSREDARAGDVALPGAATGDPAGPRARA